MGDVARLAGVSHQTVSRVLNDSPHVRPDTRARVRAAMDELGYRPNLTARSLATQRSGLIGVLATGLPHSGPSRILTGIETAARAAGYTALVAIVDDASDDVDAVLAGFASRRVDGIAVIAPHPWLVESAAALAGNTPMLLVTGDPGAGGLPSVGVDQVLGARLAVEHLIGRGLTDIAHVSGPRSWVDATLRIEGWRDALAAAGLRVGVLHEGDWSAERAFAIGTRLASGPLPEAIFCANDLTALGIIAALRGAGVSVPGEVSVVGFDDIPGAAFLDPPLTTVRQPLAEAGAHCVDALLAAMAGAPGARTTLSPELVVRASTR